MSSILRSSKFIRYFVGLARNIVISNRQDVDGNLLQRSQHLTGVFSSGFSSSSNLQAGSTLQRTISRLDEDARRTGRISMREVEEALNEIRQLKKASTSQSLMVIRCCGNLVPEETPEHRTKLVDEIWNTLETLGVSLDISHYNALLKVYLENEHKFSPTDFLAKLEKQGVVPNRVTYQRLIAGYCQLGDIAGATKILEFMKEKEIPVSEGVFNALILGHSQADDMESAEGMLSVMKQANLEPSNDTYTTLMSGYARRGDKKAIERLITDCKVRDVLLSDKDFLEIAYTAAINGHDELVDEILKNIRRMHAYNQDAANVLLRLVTVGKDEAAYKVFMTMDMPVRPDGVPNMSGHLFIKQMVKINRPLEQILAMCERLKNDGHTNYGLMLALETSFHHGNIDLTLDLLRALKKNNEPIRNHYFWPSLSAAGKSGNIKKLDDILKMMVSEFELLPNYDTLTDYYLPFIGSKLPQENLKTVLEIGVGRRQALLAFISQLISQNKLKEALEMALQNQGVNFKSVFLNRLLVDALGKTGDVKSVVGLIHVVATNCAADRERAEENDESIAPEEVVGKFLVSLTSYSETRSKIADVLKEMVNCGLSISNSYAELVESRLQGNQLTTEISDMLAKMSSGDLSFVPLKRTGSGTSLANNPAALERIREKIKANNEPIDTQMGIVRSLFHAYFQQGDLENALRMKQEWVDELKQELTPGWWAQLMELYCSKGDLEGVKKCLENIKLLCEDNFQLDSSKILKAAKLYIQNNEFDEAMNLLKAAKPRDETGYYARAAAWQLLLAVADTSKEPEQVKKVFNVLLEQQFIDASNAYLGPIIKAYLLKDDIEGALKEFEHCVKLYRATPWKNEIAQRLIEKEDAVNLQTLVDLSTQVHGEINSLYDLVLVFVECGRIRQARKILETPGLRSRNNRILYACERYKNEGLMAPLEGLVEATKDLTHIDRSEIYYNLLETYCKTDNVEKALGLWTQMQDEDVNVTDEFLFKLGNFLKSKNLEVPFEIPKSVQPKEVIAPPKRSSQFSTEQSDKSPIFAAIIEKDIEKALEIKDNIMNSGKQLTRSQVSNLMDLLVEKERLREATSLLTSLNEDKMPHIRSLNQFIKRLSQTGDLDMMKSVGDCLSDDLKKLTSFINKYMTCAVIAGKAKEELDKLEKQIDEAKTEDEIDSLSLKFPRGGIFAVLEASPSYHEQVTQIVEKYYSKGSVAPANSLCMFYMAVEQFEKGKEMYKHYNLGNSSRLMFKNVLAKARFTSNPKLLEELISLLKDTPAVTSEAKGVMYSNLINIYIKNDDPETGLAKLEEGLKSIPLENFYIKTLQTLKERLETRNIPFKYTIPLTKAKESSSSSSSSSSSDAEPKERVAVKH